MSETITRLKQEMCEIGHRIWVKGFCAGNEGNHSIRVSEDLLLCTPTRISKGFLTPDQITMVNMRGEQLDTENRFKRTSEVLLHIAIYNKRPDVKAVIHTHSPHATAFAIADVDIPCGIHPEAEVFLGKVPMAKYAPPSKKELGESVCALIKEDTNVVMMGNHGSVTFSDTLTDAFYRLEILDAYCRMLLLARQVGGINLFSKEQVAGLLELKQDFGLKDVRIGNPDGIVIEAGRNAFLDSFPKLTVNFAAPEGGGGKDVETGSPAFEALVEKVAARVLASLKK
jgi:L-fuculose-phosphate aldolase